MTELLKTPGAWPRILLARADAADPTDLDAAVRAGAFDALKTAVRAMTPGQVIAAIAGSGLRGLGGAGFPAGERVASEAAPPTARGSTSWPGYGADPAVQVDRTCSSWTCTPSSRHGHCRLAIGATEAFIAVRAEATERSPSSRPSPQPRRASSEPDVLESGWGLRVEIRPVQGAYLLGEETVLLRRSGQARPARAAPAAPHRARAVRPPDGRPQRPDPGGGAVDRQARSGGIRRDRLEGEPRHDPSSSFAPGWRRDRRGPAGDALRELVGLVGGTAGRAGQAPTRSRRCSPAGRRWALPPDLLDTPYEFDALRAAGATSGSARRRRRPRLRGRPRPAHPVLRQTRPAARRSCGSAPGARPRSPTGSPAAPRSRLTWTWPRTSRPTSAGPPCATTSAWRPCP